MASVIPYGTAGPRGNGESSRLGEALAACRGGFWAVVVFSLFVNVLMLTAPLGIVTKTDLSGRRL